MAYVKITHLETDDLHPLWQQYDGQLNTQPAFIEHDTRDGSLSADYSGEVGGGVPMDVFEGKRQRYSISPHLTQDEINKLLDDVGFHLDVALKDAVYHERWQRLRHGVCADVERMCADRLTESHGVLGVEDWMQGIDPCAEYDITADSTDDDLETIGAAMVDYATGEGCTITGVSDYCKHLRFELRRSKEEQ